MDVERVIVRLFADATPYNLAMIEAERKLLGFAGTVGMIGKLLDLPIKMATIGLGALTIAAAGAGFAALKLAADFESVAVSFEVMTGSAETGAKLLREINALAVETPFKSTGLQSSAKELSAFGTKADEIIPTLRALGDVASGVSTGNLDEMMGRIVLAFGQVRTAGRLMGPEARQFIQAGVPIYEYLAQVMGKPVQMMKLLIEEGKVGFPDVVRAFNLMTTEGGRFFNMMERQSQTVRGRWSALVETIEIGLRDIGLAAFEGLGIKNFLEDLRKGFGTVNKEEFVKFFRDVRDTITQIWMGVKLVVFWIEKAGTGAKEWYERNRETADSILQIAAVIGGIVVTVTAVVAGFTAISTLVALIASPIGQLVLGITALVAALQMIKSVTGGGVIGDDFVRMAKNVRSDFELVISTVKTAFLNEDWDTVGKTIGLAMKIGFRTAWAGLIVEIKVLFMDFIEWLTRTLLVSFVMIITEAGLQIWGIFDKEGAAEKRKKIQVEVADFAKSLNEVFNGFRNDIRKLGDADLENDLKPFREQLKDLSHKAAVDEYIKNLEKWKAANPFLYAVGQARNEIIDKFALEIADELKLRKRVYGPDMSKWVPAQVKEWEQMHSMITARMRAMLLGTGIAMGIEDVLKVGGTGAGAGGGRVMMTPPLALRAEVLDYAGDIRREMAKELQKGIGFGAGQFANFMKTMGVIQEGLMGPLAQQMPMLQSNMFMRPLADLSKSMAVLSQKEADFATFREFQNLRRWVGASTDRLPPTAMIGSTEAADIINRSQMQQTDRLAEIAAILKAAELLEEQQKRLLEEEVELLKRVLEGRERDRRGF